MNKGQKVEVVVYLFQGVVDSVNVYADDEKGKAEDKALAFLREQTGENFKNPSEFQEWMEAELEGDCDNEYHWYATTVE